MPALLSGLWLCGRKRGSGLLPLFGAWLGIGVEIALFKAARRAS